MPGYRIHRTASPYNAEELVGLDFEQTADILYIAHENHEPTKLIRSGHYEWSFDAISFGPTIAAPAGVSAAATVANTDAGNSGNAYAPQVDKYVVTAYDEVTGQESRASTADDATNDLALKRNFNTITWSAVTGATGYKIYKKQEKQEYGNIGTTTELSFVDRNIGPDLSEGPPVGDNPFADASDYPATITFIEQRAAWGRSINNPNGLWLSRSADYENMDFRRPTREDDAFAIRLVANKVNLVNQLVPSKQGLLALTSNNIFLITGSNQDYLAASPPPKVRPEISRGVSRLNPIVVDNIIFYETAKLSSVRTIGYQFEMDGIKTDDLTVFSPHFFENQDIVEWAYAEKPASCFWIVRGDGRLLCLTWEQEQEVWGWTLCQTGEDDADGNPTALFKSVCVISEGGEDRAYFIVERTVNGETKQFIERMASELWQDQQDACYLDCARTFTNSSSSRTVDRLDHLEGETVAALVDGNVVTGLVVENGEVEIPFDWTLATVGLPFTALIETLPLAFQSGSGWNVAKSQQIGKVVLRVVKTRGLEAGPDMDQLFPVKQRENEDYDEATGLLTGDVEAEMAGTSGNECVVIVRSVDPLPMHIAAILVEPSVNEDD